MSEMSFPDPAEARPTLAARLAERSRLRAIRAERLARLRPPASPGPPDSLSASPPPASSPPASVQSASVQSASVQSASVQSEATRPAPIRSGAVPADDAAETALQEFLRALTGDLPSPAPAERAEAAEVLSFQRPAPAPEIAPALMPAIMGDQASSVSELERLPGVGPNLVWALEQAGVGCLADLASLAPEELVDRLGPIGRLVPAAGWIAAARAAQPAG